MKWHRFTVSMAAGLMALTAHCFAQPAPPTSAASGTASGTATVPTVSTPTAAVPTGVQKGAPPPAGSMLSGDTQPCGSFKKDADGAWTNTKPLLVNGASVIDRKLHNTTETKWLDNNCAAKASSLPDKK